MPQLHNVVQELAVAAGVPMPRVYLIDDTAPNAFATGRDPEHASVAITTGLLQKLDREELQGVMAHELSHVRNFDIRFSLIVGVLVGSIALLADFFLRFTFWGGAGRRGRRESSDSGAGGIQVLILIIAIVLAILAPIISRLVQLAVSRQREYLADASGVELTRNPVGLERALAKITLDTEPLEVANRATQHLYFDNPIKAASSTTRGLLSTHPPALERINRLRKLTGKPPVPDATLVLDPVAQAAALRAGGSRHL
jgi:heat shock protein HtpX